MFRQSSPEAECEKTINIGPICRFGPGGDFVTVWPREPVNMSEEPKSSIAGLLNVIAGMIEVLRGHREIQGKHYDAQDGRAADTKTGRDAGSNRQTPEQRWLFADDRGTGGTIKYKPHHRIRAHRTASRQRICFRQSGDFEQAQGTLFETELKGTKSA